MAGTGAVHTAAPPPSRDEIRLVERAVAGEGQAFAELYDRYERTVFNLCYRITGSGQDAADATQDAFLAILQRLPELPRSLNFPAYVLTCARHASYRTIEARRRTAPAGEASSVERTDSSPPEPVLLDEDPQRAALLSEQQESLRRANAALPSRQREVLALRELEGLSYDDIGAVMNMNRNSVAQLIFRARLALRAALRAEEAASITTANGDCERAMPLIAMRDDGQLAEETELPWLSSHLARCPACRARAEAVAEAGASYRAWAPVVPLVALRDATIAKAAEAVGVDRNSVAATGRRLAHKQGASRGIKPPPAEGSPHRIGLSARIPRHVVVPLGLTVLFSVLLAALVPGQLGIPAEQTEPARAGTVRALEPRLDPASGTRDADRRPNRSRRTVVEDGGAADPDGSLTGGPNAPTPEPPQGASAGARAARPTDRGGVPSGGESRQPARGGPIPGDALGEQPPSSPNELEAEPPPVEEGVCPPSQCPP